MTNRLRRALFLGGFLAATILAGCGRSGSGAVDLELMSHGGTDAERAALEEVIGSFNAAQDEVRVAIEFIAEGDYNDVLQSRAIRGEIPDIVEVDGPLVAAFASQELLAPLEDGLVDGDLLGDLLPSLVVQGTWNDHLWAMGTFESGLGLLGSRSALESVGARLPASPGDAWTADEFERILGDLAAVDPDGKVLDLKLNYGVGEWFTYGFGPLLHSAGGGFIDEGSGRAGGVLDSRESTRALEALGRWAGFAEANEDDAAFATGRVALSWVGHWGHGAAEAALGDDLVLLPLPDLGRGSRTGQGSWAWSISSAGEHPEAAARVLEWIASPEQVLRVTEANAAVPGTRTALARSERHGPGGDLRLYVDQLERACTEPAGADCVSVARPVSPEYPVITAAFATAVEAVLAGDDPAEALAEAAAAIDAGA